ncbi:plasmid replication, integration and excision activator [Kitasatospora sp. NPDC001309]|uniref:plasmid replication, integration and excision activator n=1 Tax=Kitasatospora sp. NPDC001309 TaxID=3364013 RepID=UPI0036CD557D
MAIRGAIPVRFEDVFPAGAFAVSVEPVADFEASKSGAKVQARDKATGQPLWVVSVIDPDPEARDTSARVKVVAPVLPVLPDAAPGLPFRPVEFDGLTVTAYVNNGGRVAYSLKATGVRAPAANRSSAKSAA